MWGRVTSAIHDFFYCCGVLHYSESKGISRTKLCRTRGEGAGGRQDEPLWHPDTAADVAAGFHWKGGWRFLRRGYDHPVAVPAGRWISMATWKGDYQQIFGLWVLIHGDGGRIAVNLRYIGAVHCYSAQDRPCIVTPRWYIDAPFCALLRSPGGWKRGERAGSEEGGGSGCASRRTPQPSVFMVVMSTMRSVTRTKTRRRLNIMATECARHGAVIIIVNIRCYEGVGVFLFFVGTCS